jgi:hypothetical protein
MPRLKTTANAAVTTFDGETMLFNMLSFFSLFNFWIVLVHSTDHASGAHFLSQF